MLESVSSLYPFFYGRVLHPLYHLLKRDGFIAADRKALATDKLDAAGLTELQRIKFSRLLREARTRSPYYRETIDTGAAEAALEGVPPHALGLPVLTRETLVERMHTLADPAIARDLIVADGTESRVDGSAHVYTDLHTRRWRQAIEIRIRHSLGVPLGERMALLRAEVAKMPSPTSILGRLRAYQARSCVLDTSDLNEARMAEYAERLRTFAPRLLVGPRRALVRFGEWSASENHHIPSLRAIVSTAEPLHKEHRAVIAETLRAPVYDRYACHEVGCIAHERPGTENLLINADRILVELLDSRGQPVREGEFGSVHVTDLDNFSMPLIRYDLGDLATKGAPSGGHPYPTLAQVDRRRVLTN
jgi:phenylacetate-CoA ligase